MKKIINKVKWLFCFPLWLLILLGYFGWSFIEMVWVQIKKKRMAKKIIFSNIVQTWKEKLTGRAKITIK